MKKKTAKKEKYTLVCKYVGAKFTFMAKNMADAENKKRDWVRYHSATQADFTVRLSNESEAQWKPETFMEF